MLEQISEKLRVGNARQKRAQDTTTEAKGLRGTKGPKGEKGTRGNKGPLGVKGILDIFLYIYFLYIILKCHLYSNILPFKVKKRGWRNILYLVVL